MENLTVVYFCTDRGSCAKKWRNGKWQYRIEEAQRPCGPAQPFLQSGENVSYITVRIPEFEVRKRKWKEASLLRYLKGLAVMPENGRVYYLYEEEAGRLLHRMAEPLPEDWLTFMAEGCIAGKNALIILQDREMEAEKLAAKYVRDLKYIGIVSSRPEEWEGFCENVYGEFGFLPEVVADVRLLHIPEGSDCLFVAGKELYGITPARLYKKSTWLSTELHCKEAKKICARAGDARYVDIESICPWPG